jgi:hypothetical protein
MYLFDSSNSQGVESPDFNGFFLEENILEFPIDIKTGKFIDLN